MALMHYLSKSYLPPVPTESPKEVSHRIPIKLGTPVQKLHEAMLKQCAFEIVALPLEKRESACKDLAISSDVYIKLEQICNRITMIEDKLKRVKRSKSTLAVFQTIKSFCSFRNRAQAKAIFSPTLFTYFEPILEEVAQTKNRYRSLQDFRAKMSEHSQDSALIDMLGLWYVCDISNQEELDSFCQVSTHIKRMIVTYDLGIAGAMKLANALKTNKTVISLVIWLGQIRDEEAKEFAGFLKENKTLRSLLLPNNKIGDEGAREFADALRVNDTLTYLSFSGNPIGDAGAIALAEALKVNRALMGLSFHGNQVGAKGTIALAESLKVNRTFRSLNLWGNQIGKDGQASLQKALDLHPAKQITLGFI